MTPAPGAVISATGAVTHPGADPRSDHVDCAVIVVAYNSADDIGRLLESVQAATRGLLVRTVVVDNQSSDRTVEVARGMPGVTVVEAGANLGYAGAINLAREHVGDCSSVLVLNADLVLDEGSVTALYEALSRPGVGVAVPRLLDEDGSVSRSLRREPTLARALGEALFGDHLPRRPGWASEIERSPARYDHEHEVDWATGAVMLIGAGCDGAVGRWDDDRFFLYSEETDYAARARRAGWRVAFVPGATAHHRQGGSGASRELVALMTVNRIKYYEKRHRRITSVVFRVIVVLHELLRSADPVHRGSLRWVLHRSSWSRLPGGRPGR